MCDLTCNHGIITWTYTPCITNTWDLNGYSRAIVEDILNSQYQNSASLQQKVEGKGILYINDGIGAKSSSEKTKIARVQIQDDLTNAGFFINEAKSDFVHKQEGA